MKIYCKPEDFTYFLKELKCVLRTFGEDLSEKNYDLRYISELIPGLELCYVLPVTDEQLDKMPTRVKMKKMPGRATLSEFSKKDNG